jgi:hypothetical protein
VTVPRALTLVVGLEEGKHLFSDLALRVQDSLKVLRHVLANDHDSLADFGTLGRAHNFNRGVIVVACAHDHTL